MPSTYYLLIGVSVRRARLTVIPLLASGLLLTACGGNKAAETPSDQSTSPGTTIVGTWPLTGLPVADGQDASQAHPVLVTKIDNSYASSPQLGLDKADLVVEELVEGGITRLAVFFYSDIPGTVGPVRSMRASDIGIVPGGANIVTSGAAPVTIRRIKDAGINFFSESDKGFFRDNERHAPYNLFAKLSEVASVIKQEPARPADYLPWGAEASFPGGRAATKIEAQFSGGHTTDWAFKGGHYVNTNSNADKNAQFPADSVLVFKVKVGDAGYKDPAGNPVPETKFEGTGDALLFHDGKVVRATWKKDGLTGAIQLSTAAGALTVPAGHVWIELVPAKDGQVSFK
jgi:hypothetical protein